MASAPDRDQLLRVAAFETVKRLVNCCTYILKGLIVTEGHGNKDFTGSFVEIALENGPEDGRIGWQGDVCGTDTVEPSGEFTEPAFRTAEALWFRIRPLGRVDFRVAGIDFGGDREKGVRVYELLVLVAEPNGEIIQGAKEVPSFGLHVLLTRIRDSTRPEQHARCGPVGSPKEQTKRCYQTTGGLLMGDTQCRCKRARNRERIFLKIQLSLHSLSEMPLVTLKVLVHSFPTGIGTCLSRLKYSGLNRKMQVYPYCLYCLSMAQLMHLAFLKKSSKISSQKMNTYEGIIVTPVR